jgi:hypothetical protein
MLSKIKSRFYFHRPERRANAVAATDLQPGINSAEIMSCEPMALPRSAFHGEANFDGHLPVMHLSPGDVTACFDQPGTSTGS